MARILGDAFLDDPVWSAIGPLNRRHRRFTNRVSFAGILAGSLRNGGRVRVARAGGAVVGASVAFEPGRWPIPAGSILWELGWLLVAGPLPAWRGIRDDQAMRATHVKHPHMYLWFLGRRSGATRHRRGPGPAERTARGLRAAWRCRPTWRRRRPPTSASTSVTATR